MKKILFCLFVFGGLHISLQAQNYDDWGESAEERARKEAEVFEEDARRTQRFNEYIDSLNRATENNIKNMRNALQNQIRIQSNQSSSNNSSAKNSNSNSDDGYEKTQQERKKAAERQRAKKQAEKARREADHQRFLAKQRAARAEAARRADERRRQKEQREREEQQRRYNEAYAKEMQQSAARYNSLHNQVDYKATEGYNRMLNARPEGTERMQSGYVPSSINIKKGNDIAYIIPKRSSGHIVSLTLSGNEYSSLNSDWDQYLKNLPMGDIPEMKRIEWKQGWDAVNEILDGGQQAYIEYIMREKNGGKLPEFKKMTNLFGASYYVFCADNCNKMFLLSADGTTLGVMTYKNNDWSDENIIKKIEDGTLLESLKKTAKVEIKGGDVKLVELKGDSLNIKEIQSLKRKDMLEILPQLKAEIKLALFDNSLKTEGQLYYVGQKTTMVAPGVSVNVVGGLKGELVGGQKADIVAKGSALAAESSTKNLGVGAKGELSAKATVLGLGLEGTGGVVVGLGGKYYLMSGRAGMKAEAGIGVGVKGNMVFGAESEVKGDFSLPGISGSIKIGGAVLKCLNCNSENRGGGR